VNRFRTRPRVSARGFYADGSAAINGCATIE
jgi:hypothetical protein